jgi:hypothetical protein
MGAAGSNMMGAWAATTNQWVRCAMLLAQCYTSLMDPRPDLAVPARSVKLSYFWWW